MALDTSTLETLFEDDWQNLYKPLQVIDTNLYALSTDLDGESTSNIESKLDEVLKRQDALEDKVEKSFDTSIGHYVENLKSQFDGLSAEMSELQNDVSAFISTYNQWENQQGEKI